MKKISPSSLQILLSLVLLCAAFVVVPHGSSGRGGEGFEEDHDARREWERIRLCDPATGRIPLGMRARELAFASTVPSRESMLPKGANNTLANTFSSSGPANIGGRTRALAIDVTDEQTILAGGVSGGIWKSVDGGASWRAVTAPTQMVDVTCITQDTRKGKEKIWYAGTGELWGGSSELKGTGVYKSTDNGETWTSLSATFNSTPESWDHPFEFVWRLVVDHTTTSQDIVYAATALGAIQRSTNGGQSWTPVLGAFANGYSYFSEVAITPSGVLYAAMSQQTSSGGSSVVKGMYRSVDGVKWTNISPSFLPAVFGRIAIGVSPSKQNEVFFVANTPNSGFKQVDFRGREDWSSLWKYTYTSGDGAGTGGSWDNLSDNLPRCGGIFGDFQSQGSYDLYIRVHPKNPDVVYVGGTNMYRSDDGFRTSTCNWIGGYGPGSGFPFYTMYPNNHPDQHECIMYPSNPDRLLCANDGGIFRTDNARAASVTWTSLNNGYLTTQFYTCALQKHDGSNKVAGGLQDNGTVFTTNVKAPLPWTSPGLGDGSYCAFTREGTVIMSRQQGVVGRFEVDSAGNAQRFARIDPKGTVRDSFLFINPFVMDPADTKRMYMPYRRVIYRCSDITITPWGSWDTAPTATEGWDVMPLNYSSKVISSCAVSTVPADRLYYGTQDGYIYRVDNARAAQPSAKDITGTGFPRGNIECIAVNPRNADSVLVVFSNYGVQSLFFTENGGTTWKAAGGNLEGALNGVGNGPSCRWATWTFVGGRVMIYVGTSVGLYSTAFLNGSATVWMQEGASSIGRAVVTMMDYRESDNMMIVATHGNGMYMGTLRDVPAPPPSPELSTPKDGTRGVLTSEYLVWKASAGAVVYNAQISTDSLFTSIFSSTDGLRDLQVKADNLEQGHRTYYWRVRAAGSGGYSAYSAPFRFVTAVEPPLQISPAAGSQGNPVDLMLVWSRVPSAASYRLQVSTSFAFASPVVDTVITDTSFAVNALLASKRYYWRVQSIDADGAGIYASRNFTTSGSTNVNESHSDGLSVWPVPAVDHVRIRTQNLSEASPVCEVYDLSGRRVATLRTTRMQSGQAEWNWMCSDVTRGLYRVVVHTSRGVVQTTVVLQP